MPGRHTRGRRERFHCRGPLETLSPLERAVFVLHEAFGFAFTEIADILDRTPAAVRQTAHRAREHVHARRPRYVADPGQRREVTERFLGAATGGDLDALPAVLAPDVTLWTDGGGKGPATSLQPVHGRDAVARLFVAVASTPPSDLAISYRLVNGDPSAVLFAGGSPLAVLVLDVDSGTGQVTGIYSVTNPDSWCAPAEAPASGQVGVTCTRTTLRSAVETSCTGPVSSTSAASTGSAQLRPTNRCTAPGSTTRTMRRSEKARR